MPPTLSRRVRPLDAAHLSVKVSLQLILERDDLDEVAPAQLFRQHRDNFPGRKYLGKTDRASQISRAVALPELRDQFCRQCRQNLLAVLGSLFLENIPSDAESNIPVKKNEGGINRLGDLLSGLADEELKVSQEMSGVHWYR
jgi:hypothetical protein